MGSRLGRSKGVAVLVVLAGFMAALCAGTASATEIIWETDFAFIHFDWNGTWDAIAYWAYGFYVLDIPDWAYLFALYGMGWDQIWGPELWGPNGAWDSTDKIHEHIYDSEINMSQDYVQGHHYTNIHWEDPLDLLGSSWIYQMCDRGGPIAALASRFLYNRYLGTPVGLEHGFLQNTLAMYVSHVLWPWQYDQKSLDTVKSLYKYYMGIAGWEYLTWDDAYYILDGHGAYGTYEASYYTCLGAGFLFTDFDHLFGTAADAAGASSIYRVDDLLRFLRNDPGHDDFSGAFYAAYGHTAQMDFAGTEYLQQASGDFNAWLYYLMWGHWYGS